MQKCHIGNAQLIRVPDTILLMCTGELSVSVTSRFVRRKRWHSIPSTVQHPFHNSNKHPLIVRRQEDRSDSPSAFCLPSSFAVASYSSRKPKVLTASQARPLIQDCHWPIPGDIHQNFKRLRSIDLELQTTSSF